MTVWRDEYSERRRRRKRTLGVAAVVLSALLPVSADAMPRSVASTMPRPSPSSLPGTFSLQPLGAVVPTQFLDAAGKLWFRTADGAVGTVHASGRLDLTRMRVPASDQLVGAAGRGVWAVGPSPGAGCTGSLLRPDRPPLQVALRLPVGSRCTAAVVDRRGDLWVGLDATTPDPPQSAVAVATTRGRVSLVSQGPPDPQPRALVAGRDGRVYALERQGIESYGVGTAPRPFGAADDRATMLLAGPGSGMWTAISKHGILLQGATGTIPGDLYGGANFFPTFLGTITTTPDGSLWGMTNGRDTGQAGLRLVRLDANLVLLRSVLIPLPTASLLTGAPDGSLWMVATAGSARYLEHFTPGSVPPEAVWTGAGDGRRWSDRRNWRNGRVPADGTLVIIPASTPNAQLDDDLGYLQLEGIDFVGGGTMTGSPITLLSYGLALGAGAGANRYRIANPLRVNFPTSLVANDTVADLTGALSGRAHLIVAGSGTVTLSGSQRIRSTIYVGPLATLDVAGAIPNADLNVAGTLTGPGFAGGAYIAPAGTLTATSADRADCPAPLHLRSLDLAGRLGGLLQRVGGCGNTVVVSGAVTIESTAELDLSFGDVANLQVACPVSSGSGFSGSFPNAPEGSVITSRYSTDSATISTTVRGGPGCLTHAVTATVHTGA